MDHRWLELSRVEYGPNDNCAHWDGVNVESEHGGNSPPGFTAFASVAIAMDPTETVTFTGTGLIMTLRSKAFPNYGQRDFQLFVYDANGKLIDQWDLGAPSGNSIVAPSLYQDGFEIPYINGGAVGNSFVLAYANDGNPRPTAALAPTVFSADGGATQHPKPETPSRFPTRHQACRR